MRLASVHLYPVKSLGGVDVDRADVQPWGLRHDRRWLVLRPDGRKLGSTDLPALLGLTAAPGSGSITLTARDGSSLTVAEPVDGPPVATDVSRLDTVRLAADEAHDWLSARLGRPDLKVLFVTGYAENAAVGNGHLDPGMQVITKPFVMAELANKIADMI